MIQGQLGHSFLREPLERHLKECDGKTLGELDVNGVFRKTIDKPKITGIAGDVIEQSVLFLKQNSRQEPDIIVDGVNYEVKTTGVRKGGGEGLEAKEPMTITAVSPDSIVEQRYFDSAFWHKIEHMLLFYYFYDSSQRVAASEYASFPLLSHQFHEYSDFTEEERRTLEKDWTHIRDFIICLQKQYPTDYESQYPRLSHDLRSSLMLLDTAPKWPHPPRFRFKRSFVTSIYRRHMLERKAKLDGTLPDKYVEVRDIENKCGELTAKYRNWTVGELCDSFGITTGRKSKSVAEPVIVGMFGGHCKKMCNIDLFSKIGLLGKSIVLTEKGARTEDTKFFTIDFDEFYNDDLTFEDSQFYEFFSNSRILFIMFEEPSAEAPLAANRFTGFKLMTFSQDFIENEVRPVWNRIRALIRGNLLVDEPVFYKNGKQIINKNGVKRTAPNFPKSKDGNVFVRGTSTDSSLKPISVNGIAMYRQQVWVKGAYIAQMLENKAVF